MANSGKLASGKGGLPWVVRYWGKARPAEGAPHGWHPLAWHSLDVAACVEALLEARPSLRAALVRALGQEPSPATEAAATALAVRLGVGHDVGKFPDGFQSVSPDACEAIGTAPAAGPSRGEWRHDNVGLLALLGDSLCEGLTQDLFGGEADPFDVLPLLASAAACHHGRPTDVSRIEDARGPSRLLGRSWEDARAFLLASSALVGGAPLLPGDGRQAARASMILAGIVNVADWLGSGAPYASPRHAPERYWRYARRSARRAVRRAGLVAASPRPEGGFRQLYPGKAPTPLQMTADTLELPAGPILVVVEEAAGGGKTEAAMALASRMLAAGKGSGVYMALPTTATADAQAVRQAEIASLLYEEGNAPPSVMLAHSAATDGVLAESDRERLAWLSDDRRRRLLSDLCVGTVDQALLAALPSKFAAVRILGLVGKVLVIDEAHAYDSYTGTLLAALLELHAALGGSAVLLSATLPRETKAALCAAFARGAGLPGPEEEVLARPAFPLVTVVSGDGTRAEEPDPAPRAPPDKEIAFVRSEAEAEEAILAAVREGLCVAWVRNTVDQAIASGRALLARHPDVTVLHSRFPESDRGRVTGEILRRFGRASGGGERCGGVVVATAVIEQSLDLDFDLIVVDLKPVEGIVQTLGRARRHARDARGNPLPDGAPDQRPHRPMLVLSPDHRGELEESWYRQALGHADFVHRDTGVLWRTADALARSGWVRYAEARRLVEEVRDPEAYGIVTPDCFASASERAVGEGYADAGIAKTTINEWNADRGYIHGGISWDDERVPTRLGDSVEVILVRAGEGGRVRPYLQGGTWSSGNLRLRANLAARLPALDGAVLPDRLARLARHAKVVALPPDGIGTGFRVTCFAGLEWEVVGGESPD
ncbi:CRISPR-associated helicase Cas3' [Roseomonas sp. E05]|uniref:CRISPR-associated helicase Cas3' n=1 Tax=Roseomonas sp. E05 TaxID=3046310 RepID=UPI0024BA0408|nr:CRISPR-associated helicase Cas3' [Roseomonas sp. E05]MDJ0390902.1 CRISPR-associated helicase Cas3' [Roseomonas sp. E05]